MPLPHDGNQQGDADDACCRQSVCEGSANRAGSGGGGRAGSGLVVGSRGAAVSGLLADCCMGDLGGAAALEIQWQHIQGEQELQLLPSM